MSHEPEVPLTWGAQLARAERILAAAETSAPREEAVELLGSLIGAPTALLRARPGSPMSRADAETYSAWVMRRAAGEATPHITGRLLFMGLDFSVGRDDPLPAPGAWRLVEAALQLARGRSADDLLVAEIGAGCGAVSLALASLEPRFVRIYAVEASQEALKSAAANGARYLLNLVITWQEGDGLDRVPEPVDVIVCGQVGSPTPPDGERERVARLLSQAPAKLRSGGAVVCAVTDERRPAVTELLARALPGAQIWVDSQSGEPAIVVAQTPRISTGGAELESER